ncbi:MAG: adenylate/guanylate cyclase domain-containing protein [Gammaproteobacteria bacterium]
MPSALAVALRRYRDLFATSSSDARIPARVRERIRVQQQASEILIGRIQLLVVITWATLYALSPKTFSEDAEIVPVPWALGAYFLFTVGRLLIAHRRRLPDWMLYLSVVIDMSLLLGLIWSFHIQYQQPAAFYLKAPLLLYVFIFIAMRALRFQVRFVLLAGLVAACGWLAMTWYAINADPYGYVVTHDYVEYLTQNRVLLGAEVNKIIAILLVTAILSVAIARARSLLVQSVVDSSAAQDLSRFVPTEVAAQIKAADEEVVAGQGEVREATILFTDIAGFTHISETLAPEKLIKTLNEYFAAIAEPIDRFGGVINQFQGDAILATFNMPKSDTDHAANAVSAALAIQQAVHGRKFGDGVTLNTRVGVNSGLVVGGLVGTGDRLGYTVHGDDVNLAARLEQLNKDYGTQIIVSERTRELAGPERFRFEPKGEVQVRGREVPTVVYSVAES